MTPATLGLVFLIFAGIVLAGTIVGAIYLGRAWKHYGEQYHKLFLKRDEDNRRHFDEALGILRECAEKASSSHVSAIRELSRPENIQRLAEINSQASADHHVANAVEAFAASANDNLRPVSNGMSPLPYDPAQFAAPAREFAGARNGSY